MKQTIEKKEVCQCRNCGNEAEMVFTCTLPDEMAADAVETAEASENTVEPQEKKQAKATATCTHCGNEADMWIDL